jgi:transposase
MSLEPIDIGIEELEQLVEQAGLGPLPAEGLQKLKAVVETLKTLAELLAQRDTTIQELRDLLLGQRTTEKTKKVLGDSQTETANGGGSPSKEAAKRKGHGRNGAGRYASAPKFKVPHPTLKPKDRCPECLKGKVYRLDQPKNLVRIKGRPPLEASVYELEALRCNLCGEVFTPPAPASAGKQKYDETAASMIALLKYGSGVPFYRTERLESQLGIPLAAATQWEIVEATAGVLEPVWQELIRQAAQGQVLHNDDTSIKILRFVREMSDQRTGLHTSGIVSLLGNHRVALFFTGRQHAGENLADLLRRRADELGPPIQMCDALSRNAPGKQPVILANCLAHARRHFVDVARSFPAECRFVLETLGGVFQQDQLAHNQQMSSDERLRLHRQHSLPLMEKLHAWSCEQFDERKVEPNSGLGKAIRYLLKHWEELTLFLRQERAPIDNNVCERALKKAILHRKNALFYRTQNGARVGDLFMSLIYTAELSGANPFDYLSELQRHAADLARAPARWLPWNYSATLLELGIAA